MMNDPAVRSLVESAHCDPEQRYRELLDHCAEVEQERDVARARCRFFVAKYRFWYRRWRLTFGALCGVVAGLVVFAIWRAL